MSNNQQINEVLDLTYSSVPDLEVIPIEEGKWLCHSATGSVRIAGPSAQPMVEEIMPLLKNGCLWSTLLAQFPGLEPAELRQTLNGLVASGVLRCTAGSPPDPAPTLVPLLALLGGLDVPADVAASRLANARIVIIGLEGIGAHLALLLARYGLRRFVLVDPYPCQPGNLPLLPTGGLEALGQPRQTLVAQALHDTSPGGKDLDITLGPPNLSPEYVEQVVAGCDCVVSCFERGFSSVHHWVNRASLRAGVPAVYAEALGHQGWAGPLVLPYRTSCYTCYRMRAVACAPDITAALAYEQHTDGQKLPRLHARPVLPSLLPQLAGLLATSVLQVVLGLDPPALAGRVMECQALTLVATVHPVLQQPDCPDCRGSGPRGPAHPNLAELLAGGDSAVNALEIAPELISPETGIIREVSWYEKDVAEPHLPYICRVTFANHHFRFEIPAEHLTSGGKGLTRDVALASGLGEAIERYAADWVDPEVIIYARRADLDGPSMNPVDLVLYAPEQYATVPYHPYEESSILGWVRGRSLVTGESVYMPALAVFLGYQVQRPEEHLFLVTSNGVAAGGSLVRAILAGTYEVIERDALMITWFATLPARRVDPSTHPDTEVRALCRAYQRRGVEIGLWRLPTDQPCAVFLALGLHHGSKSEPAVIAGAGADLAPAAAARKAILEVGQIRPSYRRSLRRPDVRELMEALVKNPQSVTTMHDHGLLYCSPDMRHALGFLLDQEPDVQEWGPLTAGDPTMQLEQLVNHFRTTQRELLYYNLTPPDLARLGLAAARVIIPGFQPVTFGAEEPRRGGARLYELPHQLGLAASPLMPEDLNPYPHPFD